VEVINMVRMVVWEEALVSLDHSERVAEVLGISGMINGNTSMLCTNTATEVFSPGF
jgi:hypothetical protein